MKVSLKTGEVIKIISLIPKAFHALSLTIPLKDMGRSTTDIKMYFSDSKLDFRIENYDNLAYIQFKSEGIKSTGNFKPSYNNLEKAYEYCFITTDKSVALTAEVVLFYEGK
jgi:hypothetical protein